MMSVSVAWRTRELGLRAALDATGRQVLAQILSRALTFVVSDLTVRGALLLWSLWLGAGLSGRAGEEIAIFAGHLGVTSAVMIAACVLACVGPAGRALRINPADALRQA